MKEQLNEAVYAYCQSLEYAVKAYGAQAPETGPFYLKYGQVLMKLTSEQTESAFNDVIVDAMKNQAQTGDKLSATELENAAAEHADDFEEAWEALEMARMIFENSGDMIQAANVRVSLGDACGEVDQWEDAAKEYGTAAGILQKALGDDRRTVEALFLAGLALQMISQREGCVKAIGDARDTMTRLVEKNPENEELKAILGDLQAKANEVADDKTWMNDEAEIEKALEEEAAGGAGDDEGNNNNNSNNNKRLIVEDGEEGEQSDESKKRKIDPEEKQ